MIYVCSIIRAIVALHNLIDNRDMNKEAKEKAIKDRNEAKQKKEEEEKQKKEGTENKALKGEGKK